jgi:hypothetical protein
VNVYFPYLRGKQYELLALKEMAPLLGTNGRIVPVIEPIKRPDGGLARCLGQLWAHGVEPILVVNPRVGELGGGGIAREVAGFVTAQPHAWNLGLLISEDSDVSRLLTAFERTFTGTFTLTLIHDGVAEGLDRLREETSRLGRVYDLISDELRERHYRSFIHQGGGVIMHDGFLPAERNADYLPRAETMFSEDFLYYQDDGYAGFGDYLTIGRGWLDGGFTPRAVAIHWTYQPEPGTPIRIRHFTSESNGDIANVGGKFLEAANKLVAFLDAHRIHTGAADIMRRHVQQSTYPGLGIVKKLSIQNHLELVASILENS